MAPVGLALALFAWLLTLHATGAIMSREGAVQDYADPGDGVACAATVNGDVAIANAHAARGVLGPRLESGTPATYDVTLA